MRALALLCCFSLAIPHAEALAGPDAQPEPGVAEGTDPVALDTGEAAPFAGVLLPESVMVHYLELDNQLIEAELRVEARNKALADLQDDIAMYKSRTWWQRHSFTAGVIVGVVGVVVAIWGAAKTLDTVTP